MARRVRQVYALQVTPWPEAALHVASLTVLEGGKLNTQSKPPYEFDVLRTYLATSRDGVHFDTGWACARLPPRCRAPRAPYTRPSL